MRRWIIFSLILLWSAGLCAQLIPYRHYRVKDGLLSSCAYTLVQDKNGLFWIGTDVGLCTFDGKNFSEVKLDSTERAYTITQVALDPLNNLTACTYRKGWFYIDKNNRRIKYAYNSSLADCEANFQAEGYWYDWCRNSNRILVIHPYKRKAALYHRPTYDRISQLFVAPDKKMYISAESGIYHLDTNGVDHRVVFSHSPEKTFYGMAAEDKDHWWLGGKGVIYRADYNVITDSIVIDTLERKKITEILIDNYGNLWCKGASTKLFLARKKAGKYSIQNITESMNLKKMIITSLYKDRSGNIWMTTFNRGVYCFFNYYISNYNIRNGLEVEYTTAIKENKHNYYIATNNGVYVQHNKTILPTQKDKESLYYIYDLIPYKDNWLAPFASADLHHHVPFTKDPASLESYTDIAGHNIQYISSRTMILMNDRTAICGQWDNRIIVCNIAPKGKAYDFQRRDTIFLPDNGKPSISIRCLLRINDQEFYCGTNAGVYKVNYITETYTRLSEIPRGVSSIHCSRNKYYVFSADKGIYMHDGQRWDSLQKVGDNDLKFVRCAITDLQGRLWIGSQKGLFLYGKKNITFFDYYSGLVSSEINSLSLDSLQNRILVGTCEGVSEIDLAYFNETRPYIPFVRVEYVSVGDQHFNPLEEIVLQRRDSRVEIKLNLTEIIYPQKLTVRYSIDDQENEIGMTDKLLLLSLSSGNHVIKIRSTYDRINWSNEVSLSVSVPFPVYRLVWFWCVVIGAILLIVFLIVKARVKAIHRRAKEKLELQNQIDQLKYQALQSGINPHFVFNALYSIQNYVYHHEGGKASDYLAKFSRLIRMILEKANDMEIRLSEEQERLQYYLELEKMRFGEHLNFHVRIDASLEPLKNFVVLPNMVIQPIIENSIIHGILASERSGDIRVEFIDMGEEIRIEVEDNGIGYYTSLKQKTADPALDNAHYKRSIGLNNIFQRLGHIEGSEINIIDKSLHSDQRFTLGARGTLTSIRLKKVLHHF